MRERDRKEGLREKEVVWRRGEPWSSDDGMRLMFRRPWVRIPAPYTGWTFFTFIYSKVCNVRLEKAENKQKEAGEGPFKK